MSEHVFENTMTYSEKQNKPISLLPEIYNPMIGVSHEPIINPPIILPKIINSPVISNVRKPHIIDTITKNK